MSNLDIRTTLGLETCCTGTTIQPATFITRGSSFSMTFDLSSKAYTFDQLEQLIFIFGKLGDIQASFKMYEVMPLHGEIGVLDSHFAHTILGTQDYITLTLTAEDTTKLDLTQPGDWLDCEVVVQIDGDDLSTEERPMTTIIEKQPALGVIDSLYSHLLGD